MNTTELAKLTRSLRAEMDMNQQQVADLILNDRTSKPISRQAISRAESEEVGTEMNNLRIAIIEALSKRQLEGPYWRFKDETAEEERNG